jgi:hypothetical protein
MRITKESLIKVIKEEIDGIVKEQAVAQGLDKVSAADVRATGIERAKETMTGVTPAERSILVALADGLKAAAEGGNIAGGSMGPVIKRLMAVLKKEGFLKAPEADAEATAAE